MSEGGTVGPELGILIGEALGPKEGCWLVLLLGLPLGL